MVKLKEKKKGKQESYYLKNPVPLSETFSLVVIQSLIHSDQSSRVFFAIDRKKIDPVEFFAGLIDTIREMVLSSYWKDAFNSIRIEACIDPMKEQVTISLRLERRHS